MNQLKRLAVVVVVLFPTALRAEQPAGFRFSKAMQIPARSQEELVVVPFDSDMHEATQADFADVRVIDGDGRAVPYLLRVATETKPHTIRHTWGAKTVSAKPLENNALEIRVKLDEKDETPNGLRLVTPLKNFEHRVRVFAAADAGNEKPLVADALVFDYSQFMDVNHSDVRLPVTKAREFRIVIDDVTAEQESQLLELTKRLQSGKESERTEKTTIARRPFRIDRIDWWREETKQAVQRNRQTEYAVKLGEVREDREKQQTIIEVHSRRDPLSGLRLKTSSRNFSRAAKVEVQETHGVRTESLTIGSGTLSQLEFRDLKQEQLVISFGEQRREQYRIVIDNRDNPQLTIDDVEGVGPLHEVVFLASATGTYRLDFGATQSNISPADGVGKVKQPQYDTTAISAALGKGFAPITATLGSSSASPTADQKPGLTIARIVNNPLFLGSGAVVLVALLAWGLFHAGRRIEQMPKDEQP